MLDDWLVSTAVNIFKRVLGRHSLEDFFVVLKQELFSFLFRVLSIRKTWPNSEIHPGGLQKESESCTGLFFIDH